MTVTAKAAAVTFWVFAGIDALLLSLLPVEFIDSPGYLFGTGIFLAFLLFSWFILDAREAGVKPSRGLKLAVILLPPIAIPYYRFRHAGRAAGWRLIGIVLGLQGLVFALHYGLMAALHAVDYYA